MRFKIDLAQEKWRLIFKTVAVNAILVFAVVWIAYLLGEANLADYQTYNHSFFLPMGQFGQFLKEKAFASLILEEMFYRGPVWFLSSAGLVFCLGKYRVHLVLIWLAILIPDYFWAMSHYPAKLPVFIAGIGFGWLVYRTKALWPAIVAHFIANIAIYFAIKIASVFIKI